MIRKTVNIFMSIVFLLTTLGFTVSMHYCGNELVDFSINFEIEACCDMEGGCCHNENEHFQLEEEFVSSVYIDNLQHFEIGILFPVYLISTTDNPVETVNTTIESADLPPPKIQTFLSLLQTYLC